MNRFNAGNPPYRRDPLAAERRQFAAWLYEKQSTELGRRLIREMVDKHIEATPCLDLPITREQRLRILRTMFLHEQQCKKTTTEPV